MHRAFTNSLLSLLLATTLLWGGCISCEQFYMFGGTKKCCESSGKCKTTRTPVKPDSGAECKQIAFDHEKSVDLHVDLAVSAMVTDALPAPTPIRFVRWAPAQQIEPSPPNLQILHSTFLI